MQRGVLSGAEFRAARDAGLNDAEIIQTAANLALNISTNYTKPITRTVVYFPAVNPVETAMAGATRTNAGCGRGHTNNPIISTRFS